MQTFVWIFRLLVLLAIVWFAVKNGESVVLRGYLDHEWKAPLSLVLLLAFIGGVLIGLLAALPTLFRQRRELGRFRKAHAAALKAEATRLPEPPPPTTIGPGNHGV
jgi:uncharacterized integral membrane protein